MSSILDNFLAARANRQPVTNDAQPVTRAEFNTLARAVEGLVQDLEAALTPEKLTAALNAALEPLVNAAAPKTNAQSAFSQYCPPADDDDKDPITNRRRGARGRRDQFIAPEGD